MRLRDVFTNLIAMVDQMVFKINEIYLFILNYFSNR